MIRFDLSGMKFGKLLVIKFDAIRGRGHSYWICKCECSMVLSVRGSHLKAGEIKSCGCSQIDNISGKIFSYLTVINYSKIQNTNAYWICKCVCGKETEVSANNLKRGQVKSCGCMAGELTRQTNLKLYGVENSSESEIIKEKIKQNNMKKYGVTCTLQIPEINNKAKATMMKKYGVNHCMQNPEIALRVAKSANNLYILKHWFSGEEIVCIASYEKSVVEYFNKNYIDYNWQAQTFTMPDGKTFRPDCYLPDLDLWIEIKGYFRGDAEEKWNWFHKEYINSELWNQKTLKEKGIL